MRRARLVDFIHEMIDRELFLVVAPAGYGKTTLLVDFASDCDIPVCWYSLGPTDAEPAVFLDYLVASIHARFPRFGADTRRVTAAADLRTDAFAVVGALVNDVQEHIPDYFMVVLDDYHEVNDGPVSELLDVLLQHLPDNFKLAISSRTMPRLRLSRLAARSQATGVGSNDLRFTTDEVRALMREHRGITLTDKAAEELTNASEGWITGIILTTHTMWQGLFESMIRGSGQEQLYEYLANEVFERQPDDIQDFLLATSILDDMEPEVAGQLAGVPNAAELFRRLEDDNLFVTRVGGRRKAYRYHHLFRDFLRARLDSDPERRTELHGRAGEIYAERGEHELAIGHQLAGKTYEAAGLSISQIGDDVFNRGRWTTLAGWIDALPEDIRSRQAGLVLWQAQVAAQLGDLERSVELCEALEKRAEELGDALLGAEAKVNRAAALRLQGENEQAIQLCEQALAIFGNEITKRRGLALRIIGAAHWRLGDLETAWQDCQASYRIFQGLRDESYEAYLQNDLGILAVLLGKLADARSQLTSSAKFWENLGNAGRFGMILSNLGVVAYLEEGYSEAIGLFETAIEKTRQSFFTFGEAAATCSLGDVYRDLSAHDRAEQCYDNALHLVVGGTDRTEVVTVLNSMTHNYRLQRAYAKAESAFRRAQASGRGMSGYQQAQSKLAGGVCALEQGRYKRAKPLLADALSVFRSGGARYQEARVLFHQAMAEYETGNLKGSDERLEQALDLLEELGYHQFLMVEGPRCSPFLEQAASRGLGEAFLRKLLPLFGEKLPAEAVQAQPTLRHVADARVHIAARALGRPEVEVGGRMLALRDWGTQAARELFFYLLMHRDGARKEELMSVLAPESPPARANSHFHVAAFRLRRALYRGCLRFENDCYRLDPDIDCSFDVERFQSAVSLGDRSDPDSAEALAALAGAVGLYRGPFLEGSFSEWALTEQRRLEALFLHAASSLAGTYLKRREFRAAIELAERGLAVDNTLEEFHEVIIRAYLGLGDATAARRQFNAFASYVKTELGTTPSMNLKKLLWPVGQEQPRAGMAALG